MNTITVFDRMSVQASVSAIIVVAISAGISMSMRPALANDATSDPSSLGNERSSVRAPFTKVDTDPSSATTRVRAPFTKVDTNPSATTTRVRAPFVKVDEDASAGTKKVRAPFVKIDRVGDQVHVRAPFVDKWVSAEEYDKEQARKLAKKEQEDRKDAQKKRDDKDD
jgi:hypothetical protein